RPTSRPAPSTWSTADVSLPERICVLASGGLDSAVLLGTLARRHAVHPLYVRCGLAWERAEQRLLARFLAALRARHGRRVAPLAPVGPPAVRPQQVRRAAARFRGRGRARPDEVRAVIGYVVRRVLRAITTLLGTTLIIFVLVRVVPADPAVTIAGPKADPETLAAIRKDLGLDDPVVVQYVRYLAGLARGDLGRSYMTGRRVADVIAERLPATAWLALTSLALGFSLGLVLGIVTAARRGSLIDVVVLLGTLIGLSIPTFWLANLLIYEF